MGEPIRDTTTAEAHTLNLLLLTWIAGMLDGLSYIRAHVFTANMTGNLVLLGVHLMDDDIPDALRSLVALGAFALGCILAAFLMLRHEEAEHSSLTLGFAAEMLLLTAFAILYELEGARRGVIEEGALIFSAAMALAVQSVTVRRLRVSGVVTTFITGTITTSLVEAVSLFRKRGRSQQAEEQHVALLIGMLAVYLAAVAFATALNARLPAAAGPAPAVIIALVLWRSRTRGRAPAA